MMRTYILGTVAFSLTTILAVPLASVDLAKKGLQVDVTPTAFHLNSKRMISVATTLVEDLGFALSNSYKIAMETGPAAAVEPDLFDALHTSMGNLAGWVLHESPQKFEMAMRARADEIGEHEFFILAAPFIRTARSLGLARINYLASQQGEYQTYAIIEKVFALQAKQKQEAAIAHEEKKHRAAKQLEKIDNTDLKEYVNDEMLEGIAGGISQQTWKYNIDAQQAQRDGANLNELVRVQGPLVSLFREWKMMLGSHFHHNPDFKLVGGGDSLLAQAEDEKDAPDFATFVLFYENERRERAKAIKRMAEQQDWQNQIKIKSEEKKEEGRALNDICEERKRRRQQNEALPVDKACFGRGCVIC